MSYSVSNETLSIAIRSISDLDQIMMLSNVLNSALFTDEIDDMGFKLQKDKILRSISESYKKPDSLLESVVSEKLFYDTPFSHQPVGIKDSVINISKKDIHQTSQISEVTINKCYKKLENYSQYLIPKTILEKYNM